VTFRTPTITRLVDPYGEPPQSDDLTVFVRNCGYDGSSNSGELVWRNLPSGETITAVIGDPYGTSSPQSSGANSGSFNLSYSGADGPVTVRVSTSGGQSFTFGCD
jgi:hypothetical protein